MNLSALDDAQYGLLFDVRRSIRYHDRRRAFFERMHRVTGALTIILAGGVIFELAGTGSPALWLQVIAAGSAILAAMDIVVGYSSKANLHDGLRVRFVDLEISMLSGDLEHLTWQGHRQKRLEIEREEPPIYRALDLLCHNELCKAEGITPNATVGTFKQLTSQLFTWSNIATSV